MTEDWIILNNRTPGSKDPSALSFTICSKSIIQNVLNLRYLFAWFLETLNAPSGKRGPSRASLVVMATVCYWLPTAIVTSKDLYSDTYSPRLCPRWHSPKFIHALLLSWMYLRTWVFSLIEFKRVQTLIYIWLSTDLFFTNVFSLSMNVCKIIWVYDR